MIEEALEGYCDRIYMILEDDNIVVIEHDGLELRLEEII